MPGADPSWRRVMVSARTDWQRKQHACREALVESRLRHRRDLLRFVSQGGCAARPTSEPSAQVVCDHAIAGPGDVRRCSPFGLQYSSAVQFLLVYIAESHAVDEVYLPQYCTELSVTTPRGSRLTDCGVWCVVAGRGTDCQEAAQKH